MKESWITRFGKFNYNCLMMYTALQVCYIPYDGKEIPCEYYEVLACKTINLAS